MLIREDGIPSCIHIGRRVLHFDSVPSTNDIASREPEGTAVVANFQTAGRGQYGRTWQSRPDASLLLSIVVSPPEYLRRPVVLTAWAAVAIGDAILELTGVQSRVKWPNDLLVRGKKVSGILIEQMTIGSHFRTVLGLGLNLNQTHREFEELGLPEATSLREITGRELDLEVVTRVVLTHLDREYSRLLAGELVPLEADWKWRVELLGRPVRVELVDGTVVAGRLLEMAFDGIRVDDLPPIRPESVRHILPTDRDR